MRITRKSSLNSGVSLAVVAAATVLGSVPASAQGTTSPAEITVTGIRGSLLSANQAKRNSGQIIDAISQEDIGKFPDKNLAESLQRVTGVQIGRQDGEGRGVSIRGGNPNMTRVEINGVNAQSLTVGAGDRAVDLRDLPVEFVERLEVVKSPTADMTEGGLGGTVRVVNRRPFDSTEPFIAGSAQAVYTNLAKSTNPKFALIGSHLFFNNTLGVLLSVVYDDKQHLNDETANTTGWLRQPRTAGGQGLNANPHGSDFNGDAFEDCPTSAIPAGTASKCDWYPQIPRYLNNRRITTRLAFSADVEYRPNDNFKFWWDTTIAHGKEQVNTAALQLNDNGGVFDYPLTTVGTDNTVNHIVEHANGSNVATGCGTAANTTPGCLPLDLTYRNIIGFLTRKQETTTLGAQYHFADEWTFNARLDRGQATVDNEEVDSTATLFGTPTSIVDYTGSKGAPNISFIGVNVQTSAGINRLDALYQPRVNNSNETSESFDFEYKPTEMSWLDLKAGFLYHNYVTTQTLWARHVALTCRGDTSSGSTVYYTVPCSTITNAVGTTAGINPIPFYSTGDLGFSGGIKQWLDLNERTIAATNAAASAASGTTVNVFDLTPFNPNANTNGSYNQFLSDWRVSEKTTDWWGEALFDFPHLGVPISGNVGVRYVDTTTDSGGYAQAGPVFSRVSQGGGYKQALPSANIKFDITDSLVARLAYGKVLARPAPSQLAFTQTLDIVGLKVTEGNPSLLPFLSTDYDAGVEWYFGKTNLVSMTFFKKDISRFIINTTVSCVVSSVTYSCTFPTNGTSPVTISGVEFDVQYAFDWLPRPFDGFGLYANYTAQQDRGFKGVNLIDGSPLPFEGLSRASYNASAYYENSWFSARVSYNWRDRFLNAASGRGLLPEFVDAFGQVDANASVNVTKNVTFFVEGINLTDQQIVQENAPARPIQFETFGSRYFGGVRFKF